VRGSKKARRMGYQGTPGGQVLRKVAGVRPAHLLYRKIGRKSRLLIRHSATEAAECAALSTTPRHVLGARRYRTGREVPVSRPGNQLMRTLSIPAATIAVALVLTPSAYEVVEGWTIECVSLSQQGCNGLRQVPSPLRLADEQFRQKRAPNFDNRNPVAGITTSMSGKNYVLFRYKAGTEAPGRHRDERSPA
jgi:hypothetical protein